MDIDGVEVVESDEEYGYSWRWDDPRGLQSEILWKREVGYLNLGTRMLPGGWNHTRLDPEEWGDARDGPGSARRWSSATSAGRSRSPNEGPAPGRAGSSVRAH